MILHKTLRIDATKCSVRSNALCRKKCILCRGSSDTDRTHGGRITHMEAAHSLLHARFLKPFPHTGQPFPHQKSAAVHRLPRCASASDRHDRALYSCIDFSCGGRSGIPALRVRCRPPAQMPRVGGSLHRDAIRIVDLLHLLHAAHIFVSRERIGGHVGFDDLHRDHPADDLRA